MAINKGKYRVYYQDFTVEQVYFVAEKENESELSK